MPFEITGFGFLSLVLSLVATAVVAGLVVRLERPWKKSLKEGVESLNMSVSKLRSASQGIENRILALDEIVRSSAEQQALQFSAEVEADAEEAETGEEAQSRESSSAHERPAGEDSYLADLRARGIDIRSEDAHWAKKRRCVSPRNENEPRGNLGWFVESKDGKRYFIHRGRSTQVRPAIPRQLLSAWESETGLNPCEVELDYRTGAGPGNHAWFLRTYDGRTWKISQGRGSIVVDPVQTD